MSQRKSYQKVKQSTVATYSMVSFDGKTEMLFSASLGKAAIYAPKDPLFYGKRHILLWVGCGAED